MNLRFLKAEQDFLEACQDQAEHMARQAYAAGLRHNDLKDFELAGKTTLNLTNILLWLKRRAVSRDNRWQQVAPAWLQSLEAVNQQVQEFYPIQADPADRPAYLAEFARQTELAWKFRAIVTIYLDSLRAAR